jgi:ABC-2 type transport system permease protein
MISRILVIARKELLQLRRDRLTIAMMVALPLVQLILFGYAINNDVRHIRTLVYDQDHSAESRDFVRSLEVTGFYDIVGASSNYADVQRAFRAARARVAIVIPPRFASDLARKQPTTVQLVVDGSDPQVVASATNTIAGLAAARSVATVDSRVAQITVEPTLWYNPDQRTAVYVVPGLVGVILTMTMVMLTSMAIARERERGTLEQLIVSPVRNVELILGKILPYVVIGYVQMTLVLSAGHLLFGVPFVGSIGLLYALAFVFIAANLAVGLFFSTLATTQQQATQMSFFFLLPNILLSGFMFPYEAMPRPAQLLAQALPLTHFLRIVRGVALKGSDLADVATELLWMTGILTLLVTLASFRFSKKLA